MKFISTRNQNNVPNFSAALDGGLAPDGGLYLPEKIPYLNIADLSQHPAILSASLIQTDEASLGTDQNNKDFADFAHKVLAPYFEGDPLESQLQNICLNTFSFPIPLRQLDGPALLLELFHGPTAAFKDVAARFLAECIAHQQIKKETMGTKRPKVVLVATSGDTGSAVAAAFNEHSDTTVFILYPNGRVSPRQERLLGCWSSHIHAVAVDGNFDDCQRLVKEVLASPDLRSQYLFISANSISVGRLLPQTIYYAWASLVYNRIFRLPPGFIIPTGNLGNGLAAVLAKQMGFPIREIILATNANRAIANYFETGEIQAQVTIPTLANAMDVGLPSNLERLHYLYPDLKLLNRLVSVHSCSDAQIETTLLAQPWGQLLCPHTATAAHAFFQQQQREWILVATAHPAKFETILEPLWERNKLSVANGHGQGQKISIPKGMQALLKRPFRKQNMVPQLSKLVQIMQEAHT